MARATRSPRGQNRLREAMEAFERERPTPSLSQPAASTALKADFDDPTFRTLVASALIMDPTLLQRVADRALHGDVKPANPLAAVRALKQTPSSPGRLEDEGVSTVAAVADLGALVRQARQDMGLSQQAFADLAGLGRRFVSELESGKATLEFAKVLSACAAAGIDLMARLRAKP